MVNQRGTSGSSSHEIVPQSVESHYPALAEPIAGDYYIRTPSGVDTARIYLRLLLRRRWTFLIAFALIMGSGITFLFTRPRLFKANADIVVSNSVATEARMLGSKNLLDTAFAALPDDVRWKGFHTTALKMEEYPISITIPKDTDIINVEVTARDPEAAAILANQLVETDISDHSQRSKRIADESVRPTEEEYADTQRELQLAQAAFANFKNQHQMVDVDAQVAGDAQELANLQAQASDADRDVARAVQTQATLTKEVRKLAPAHDATPDYSANPLVRAIDLQIEKLEQDRVALLQDYKPTAREITDIDAQITATQQRKTETIQRLAKTSTPTSDPRVDGLEQQLISARVAEADARRRSSITRAQITHVQSRIRRLPDVQRQAALMMSHIQVLSNAVIELSSHRQALRIGAITAAATIMPGTPARPPRNPSSPNLKSGLLMLIVFSLVFAVGAVIVCDQLDDRLNSTEVLEETLGLRVLASLPSVRNGFGDLVTAEDCPPPLQESFRILRTSLFLALRDSSMRLIAVTSAQPSDGKSTIVVNLASTFARGGKRTLVVDCDLRHPSVHRYLGMDDQYGLTSVLLGESTFEESVQQARVENLYVLTAGVPSTQPYELLAGQEMVTLLDSLRNQYDIILLDCPPIVNNSDGMLLASLAGSTVIVTSDSTRKANIQAAIRLLDQSGVPILGIISNRATEVPVQEWTSAKQRLSLPSPE
ncbi:MAG: polysaccharide biosynthesis tyrosine autokinase [Armatimonadota bacterium]